MSWRNFIKAYDERRDILIPGDKEAALEFCMQHFFEIAEESIRRSGIFTIALSGGSTPAALYKKISESSLKKHINWRKVFLFWSDERAVPPDSSESNFRMAMHSGMEKLDIPFDNIFRMVAEENIEEEAKNYELHIREKVPHASFDYMMLGMGEDGHTASLFPKTHALHTDNRLVVENYLPEKKTWRMTVTYECINRSKHIVILVVGANKAETVKKALASPYNPNLYPIQKVGTEHNKALWILDQDAASFLVE